LIEAITHQPLEILQIITADKVKHGLVGIQELLILLSDYNSESFGADFCPCKERPCRLAGGKSKGLDTARVEKVPTESLV